MVGGYRLVKGAQWASTGLLREMQQRGVEPNVITSECSDIACGRRSGNKHWSCSRRCSGGGASVIAISACEKERSGNEHFEEMQRRGEADVITWNAAISACEKGAQWEQTELFEERKREKEMSSLGQRYRREGAREEMRG